jgi:uncharacterized membrane protein YbhN (UPF0104 family)
MGDAMPGRGGRSTRQRVIRVVQAAVSIAVAVVMFGLVIPKIANYGSVWKVITSLTSIELLTLVGATIFNLFTYWWQMVAAMPGLTTSQAAVNNQTSTTIANILPAGGAIAVGVAVAMFRSWGFTRSSITLEITLTGIWNSFLKLGMPVIALLFVAITGHASPALVAPAVIGLGILLAAIAMFALMLSRKRYAKALGDWLGRVWSAIRRIIRKPPVVGWGDRFARFRHDTIELLGRRWIALTVTTILSHIALYLILLLTLRAVGVSGTEVSWAQVLAVFSFGRLITALPITPGGVGLIEAAYIAALVAIGKAHAHGVPIDLFKAQIAAAVLLFRSLTYGIQIPLGGFTYLIWRAKKGWLKVPPDGHAERHTVGAPATPTPT